MFEGFLKDTRVQPQVGDYMKDGLLFCGRCNTPRETEVSLLGKKYIKPCMCKCREEAYNKWQAKEEEERRMLRVNRLRSLGFPDEEMLLWTFDRDSDPSSKTSEIARNYVEHFDEFFRNGKGILFYGPVGTGKTFLSACIVNELINKGHPCLCTNFARITNTVQSQWDNRQTYLDSLNRFDLLVIDDLAAERDTEYMGEIIMSIIDSRYRAHKPIIVTTNLTRNELRNPQSIRRERVFSRLFEMCMMVEVSGADRRKQKAVDDYERFSKLLGL